MSIRGRDRIQDHGVAGRAESCRLLSFTVGANDRVEGLSLRYPHEPLRTEPFRPPDHQAIARRWRKERAIVESVVIVPRRLREDMWDDPRFMHQEHVIECSEVEEACRRRLMNGYFSHEDVDRIVAERGFPKSRFNFKPEEHPTLRTELEDALFRAQELELVPEVAAELLAEARAELRDQGLRGAAFRKALEERRREMFLPRHRTEYRRVYPLPEPFNWWDERNPFQQWYLVGDGAKVTWVTGGSGGSSQRECHGRYAHACASLQRLGVPVPTVCFILGESNDLALFRSYPRFRAVDRDLTGNYHADWRRTKDLFKRSLLRLDPESMELREVEPVSTRGDEERATGRRRR